MSGELPRFASREKGVESVKYDWTLRLLVRTGLALTAPIMGIAEVSAQADTNDVFRLMVAPATAQNPRNSESDIIELRDGRLLLGWTGGTWGDKYTLVENDGKCNVMDVNFLRLKSGGIALFPLQNNVEGGGKETPDC